MGIELRSFNAPAPTLDNGLIDYVYKPQLHIQYLNELCSSYGDK